MTDRVDIRSKLEQQVKEWREMVARGLAGSKSQNDEEHWCVVELCADRISALLAEPAPPDQPSVTAQRLDAMVTAFEALMASGVFLYRAGKALDKDECIAAMVVAAHAVNASSLEVRAPAQPAARTGWQPIETAPKDCSVLLWWVAPFGKPSVVMARWMCRTHSYLSRPHRCPNEPDCEMGWDMYSGEMTHWMPLPDPPVQS